MEDIEIEGPRIGKGRGHPGLLRRGRPRPEDPRRHRRSLRRARAVKDHVSFGHGAHHCIGAPLARMEGEPALPALFRRFPDIRPAVAVGELKPVVGFVSNGHQEMPVYLG
ncbi:cytochrome P450 [Nocardia sp. NPDC002869]|uniref:cytochrome P450 n=1 Tax=Nocardia sp. NPDC002869 TaxID=3161032 RepID=UPI00398D0839